MDASDDMLVRVFKPTRSDRQNAKLHAMLAEIQNQVDDLRTYSIDDIKLRFMNALQSELRFLPCLEGQGQFPVGQRTSKLTKEQFAGLIELVNGYAARNGVTFRAWEYD